MSMGNKMPRIATRKDNAAEYAAIWRNAYYRESSVHVHWERGWFPPDAQQKYEALIALGDNPNPDDVDKVVDYPVCQMICDCCGKSVNWTTLLGEEPGYESRTCDLCADCIFAAYVLASEYAATTAIEGKE